MERVGVILEVDIGYADGFSGSEVRGLRPVGLLVLALVYLVDAFEGDFDILERVDKRHELLHRRVELPDDILHGEHSSEGHLPVDYGCRGKDGYDDVFHLVDEDASCLLGLLQFERLHLHREEVGLCVLPFPPPPAFAVLQLYFLHGGDELVGFVLVLGLLFEQLVV